MCIFYEAEKKPEKLNKEEGRLISCLRNILPGLHFLLGPEFLKKFEKNNTQL